MKIVVHFLNASIFAFSALTLLVGCQEQHLAGQNCDEVLWLSVWNMLQMISIWSS